MPGAVVADAVVASGAAENSEEDALGADASGATKLSPERDQGEQAQAGESADPDFIKPNMEAKLDYWDTSNGRVHGQCRAHVVPRTDFFNPVGQSGALLDEMYTGETKDDCGHHGHGRER